MENVEITENKLIYMDNAATTRMKQEVIDEMMPYFSEIYFNPSSIYMASQVAKTAVEESRNKVAKAFNAEPSEIYFTGGGSEGDNFAIKGVAQKYKNKGNHIITTQIEHHAVLHTCEYLEKNGFEVTYLPVDEEGRVRISDLKNAVKDTTILVSIMAANNEIGTIQPIGEIGAFCREKGIIFHTDAVQAVGQVELDVKKLNIDLLSMSAHKIHGPKGVGAMYIRKGIRIENLIHGGAQERGRRAGTENVPGIVGLGKAIELATEDIKAHVEKLSTLRDKLIDGLLQIPFTRLNGPRGVERLSNNVNVVFEFIEGEGILLSLDFEGICGSSGSACTSGSLDPSHVLLAIGLPHEIAHGSLRLSLSDFNTEEEVDTVITEVPKIIERLRSWSPLWSNHVKNSKGNE